MCYSGQETTSSDVRENFIFTRTNLTLRTCERSTVQLEILVDKILANLPDFAFGD